MFRVNNKLPLPLGEGWGEGLAEAVYFALTLTLSHGGEGISNT